MGLPPFLSLHFMARSALARAVVRCENAIHSGHADIQRRTWQGLLLACTYTSLTMCKYETRKADFRRAKSVCRFGTKETSKQKQELKCDHASSCVGTVKPRNMLAFCESKRR